MPPILLISAPLLAWFDLHGRKDLPWQQQPTPYHVWVSEIMLQQTQVNTVIPYYQRFIQRFPNVTRLARAELDEVLHHWTGLGYYARARHLHRAAQQVCEQYQAQLPADFTALLNLAGIGRSTAGAILALAFELPYPILDGNVKRVLCRYHAIDRWAGEPETEKQLWALAEQHTPQQRVKDYTQAIMDLGATVCTRQQPRCVECPLIAHCEARRQNLQHQYPLPRPRKTIPTKAVNFIIIHTEHATLLQQRPPQGIWGGLWSFPECTELSQANDWALENLNIAEPHWKIGTPIAHTFTHFHLEITPLYLKLEKNVKVSRALWYDFKHPPTCGLAAPVARLLAQFSSSPLTTFELFKEISQMMVNCVKLGREAEGLDRPPYPGELGKRIYQNVSKEAWQMWIQQQTMLINEYRLSPVDPQARRMLEGEMEKFFFGEGSAAPSAYTPPK